MCGGADEDVSEVDGRKVIMKVEFESSELGDILSVEISQFLRAKESDEEYESLSMAVYAYYSTFCFSIDFDEAFELICKNIGKRGRIIFAAKENKDKWEKYPEFYVVSNNRLKKIYSEKE